MTGKDLIIYILQNNLEDEPVFQNGTFIGFKTMDEASVELNVGLATIYAWMVLGRLDYVRLGEKYLVPVNDKMKALQNDILRKNEGKE